MGAGIGSIETAYVELFIAARDEMLITTFSIGVGHDPLFTWIETALARGVLVRAVINRFRDQPTEVVSRLTRLNEGYRNFELYSFESDPNEDLHAKVVVRDREEALIGSSNLSRRGFVANHELGVVVEGQAAVTAGEAFDHLLNDTRVIRVS